MIINPYPCKSEYSPATATAIAYTLRHLQEQVGQEETAVVRLSSDDHIDWDSFPVPACGLPGSDVGQIADMRFSLTDGTGLHGQRFPDGRVEFHLDQVDACRAPIEHGARETRMVQYGAWGALVFGALGYVADGPRGALLWGGLGAGGGVAFGANTPKRSRRVFALPEIPFSNPLAIRQPTYS